MNKQPLKTILSATLLLSVLSTSAAQIIDCSFSEKEGFLDNGKSKAPFLLNHDYGNTGANNSIIDGDGNVWIATQGTSLKSYFSKNYAGTLPETYILPGDAFEIIINPNNLPSKSQQRGWFSVDLRLGTSGQTNYQLLGWRGDRWETLLEITDLSTSKRRKIVDHPIPNISLYSKYMFRQKGGSKPVKATIDNFVISTATSSDSSELMLPIAYDHFIKVKRGLPINLTLTGDFFTTFNPPSTPLNGIIVPTGDCNGQGVLHYKHDTTLGGSDSFTYTSGEFATNGQLTYTSNRDFIGNDYFTYTSRNGMMTSKIATVRIKVLGQLLNFPLTDLSSSNQLTDRSIFSRNIDLSKKDTSTFSLDGKSLNIKRDDCDIQTQYLGVDTNTITIVAWIKPDSTVKIENYTSILMTRSGKHANGLSFYNENLGFFWGGDASIYNWASGLKINKGQWQFIALIIAPDGGTVCLGNPKSDKFDSKQLQKLLKKQLLEQLKIGGEVRSKSGDNRRTFIGKINGLRMWNYAMEEAEVEKIFSLEKNFFR